MNKEEINLEQLKKSSTPPASGDIFALKVKGIGYYYGRVIKVNVKSGFGDAEAALIYLYDYCQNEREPVPDTLDKKQLIIPPLMINYLPWRKGYFETLINRPILKEDVYSAHCFKDPMRDLCFDENGSIIKRIPNDSIFGEYGLSSYGYVHRLLSKKLNLDYER